MNHYTLAEMTPGRTEEFTVTVVNETGIFSDVTVSDVSNSEPEEICSLTNDGEYDYGRKLDGPRTPLNEYGEYERVLRECKEMFGGMAARTDTLWEHLRPTASCDHAISSYAAVAIIRALNGIKR